MGNCGSCASRAAAPEVKDGAAQAQHQSLTLSHKAQHAQQDQQRHTARHSHMALQHTIKESFRRAVVPEPPCCSVCHAAAAAPLPKLPPAEQDAWVVIGGQPCHRRCWVQRRLRSARLQRQRASLLLRARSRSAAYLTDLTAAAGPAAELAGAAAGGAATAGRDVDASAAAPGSSSSSASRPQPPLAPTRSASLPDLGGSTPGGSSATLSVMGHGEEAATATAAVGATPGAGPAPPPPDAQPTHLSGTAPDASLAATVGAGDSNAAAPALPDGTSAAQLVAALADVGRMASLGSAEAEALEAAAAALQAERRAVLRAQHASFDAAAMQAEPDGDNGKSWRQRLEMEAAQFHPHPRVAAGEAPPHRPHASPQPKRQRSVGQRMKGALQAASFIATHPYGGEWPYEDD